MLHCDYKNRMDFDTNLCVIIFFFRAILMPKGLSPSSQYRVTVRAKHNRSTGHAQTIPPSEEAPGAYTDFRTLTKGLPDPPQV